MNIEQYIDQELPEIGQSMASISYRIQETYPQFNEAVYEVQMLWSDPWASIDAITQAENKTYQIIYEHEELHTTLLTLHREREKTILQFVMKQEMQGELLDLGCGSGLKTIFYALATSANVTGVDKLSTAITLAEKRRCKQKLQNVTFAIGNIADSLTGLYDIVLATNVLHETGDNRVKQFSERNLNKKIQNISSVSKKRGVCVITYCTSRHAPIVTETCYLLEREGYATEVDELDEHDELVGIVGKKI